MCLFLQLLAYFYTIYQAVWSLAEVHRAATAVAEKQVPGQQSTDGYANEGCLGRSGRSWSLISPALHGTTKSIMV